MTEVKLKLKLKLTTTSTKEQRLDQLERVAMKHWRNSPNIYRTPIVVIWSTVIHNSQRARQPDVEASNHSVKPASVLYRPNCQTRSAVHRSNCRVPGDP